VDRDFETRLTLRDLENAELGFGPELASREERPKARFLAAPDRFGLAPLYAVGEGQARMRRNERGRRLLSRNLDSAFHHDDVEGVTGSALDCENGAVRRHGDAARRERERVTLFASRERRER